MIGALFLVAGIAIVLTTLVDVFCSLVRTPLRAGPLTTLSERIICRGLYRLFRRTGRRNLLASIGPASVAARAAGVLLGLFAGWYLIFSFDPDWIVVAKTGVPATWGQRLYYVGYCISTLGLGDIVPNTVPARIATVGASLTGFTVITFVVGSISPLSDVVADRNAIAVLMDAHYQSVAHGSDEPDALKTTLAEVLTPLMRLATALETLPIQHRMHAEREHFALSVALDRLARSIASHGEGTDMRCIGALSAIDRILAVLGDDWLNTPCEDRLAALAAFRKADGLSAP